MYLSSLANLFNTRSSHFVFLVKEINPYKKSNSKSIKSTPKLFKIRAILFTRDYLHFFREYVVFFVKSTCCNLRLGGHASQLAEKDRAEKLVSSRTCTHCHVIGKAVYMSQQITVKPGLLVKINSIFL